MTETSKSTYSMYTSPTSLPRPLLDAFRRAYPGHSPDVFVRAPGRINLLGGHVDMHDGFVINIAINREIWLAAAYGAADLVRIYAADLDESTVLPLKRLDEKQDVVGNDLPRWAHYPAGVAWALQRRGLKVNGIDVAFLGDVVMRAGLSSSAAVEEAFAIAWQALEYWQLERAELAQVGREAERDYMGIGTGIQDQFTCLHAREGQVIWLDCRTLEHTYLPFPPSARVVVCDTNTRPELAGSKGSYNGRAQDCHDTAHTIGLVDRQVKTLRDVPLSRLEDFEPVLTADQFRRSRHVITEIARTHDAVEALQQGDVAAFGRLMNESYWSARDDYGSSSDVLDAMWSAATQHAGCFGARYSGGGEAGAIVALVDVAEVEDFITCTIARYEQSTGLTATLFVAEPAEGAGVFM
ncbi:MAG: galactokinase [Chloroflexi bacterium]|nr:galactokinase [Chloroflexota bacterium]